MTGKNNKHLKIALYGGTGQAKLIRPILENEGHEISLIIDDTPNLTPPFKDIPLFFGYAGFLQSKITVDGFVVTIGNPHAKTRLEIAQKLKQSGLTPVSAIHPSALIETNKSLGPGCQILAHAYIAVEAQVGAYCILNAGAQLDHESVLEDGVELGPGAIICGACHIGTHTWIGAGAVVKDRVRIGRNVIVGAGAVVTQDIPDGLTCVGVPAKPIEKKS